MEAHTPEVGKTGDRKLVVRDERERGREGGREEGRGGGRKREREEGREGGKGRKGERLLLTENHGRVDLAVSVSGAVADTLLLEVIRSHGNHHRLLLQSINVLHHTPSH